MYTYITFIYMEADIYIITQFTSAHLIPGFVIHIIHIA